MPKLTLANARSHNLKNILVEIPLERFVCITGVSGSGKTTLVRDVLVPLLESKLRHATTTGNGSETEESAAEDPESTDESVRQATLHGYEKLQQYVLVDQSPLGKTPRSNPAVYVGAFEHVRELFAQTDLARQRGLNASAFSFNSAQGQCERCRGAGFEKIEMQFLSDVFIRCPECSGKRYRSHILEVTLSAAGRVWNIADTLDATVDEAITFFGAFDSRQGRRAVESLRLLGEVGLGYLRLGQPINTLSGDECQRLKLVSYLADSLAGTARDERERSSILFLFDEPTTGLHFEDINVLLKVFHRLVEAGNSLVVIEHNLDVIKAADWVIDLGPGAGDEGGQVVIAGSPTQVAACDRSLTGGALRGCSRHDVVADRPRARRPVAKIVRTT